MALLRYPPTRKIPQVDYYHGLGVPDPYQWLEDETSPDRTSWVAAQNSLTGEYLSGIATRKELRCRFDELVNYPRYYDLIRRGPYLFYKKNDGLQAQLVVYAVRDLGDTPQVVVDPTTMIHDGTICVTAVMPSKDANYVAYGLSHNGSESQEYRIRSMEAGRDLPDMVQHVRLSTVAWQGAGFYYSRCATGSEPARCQAARQENHEVWYHRVGTPQSADALVHQDQTHPLRLHSVQTSEDERFAVLSVRDYGCGHVGNALWLLDGGPFRWRLVPIVTSFDDEFWLVDNESHRLLLLTNHNAPNWRLVMVDPFKPSEAAWVELIAERRERLERVTAVGGRLFAVYRTDAAHQVVVFGRNGKVEHEIPLPGIGLAQVYPGQLRDTDALWSFTNFTTPLTIYRYSIATCTSSVSLKPSVPFDTGEYETRRVFYPSRDGVRIPMFIVHRKGLSLNGQHPSLLYGYGGNGTSIGPAFDPLLISLLERGLVYAVACLRGGGEYGESWHRAGSRERKQNTFDDCIAAAEWLQTSGYTTRKRAGLIGSSNGGLLVAAVMVQRPDLFKVALPDVGVMDMLRFHLFTTGATWIPEYGSSDDPEMLPILLSYSPLHNVRSGVRYPATLVTTSAHDDRVVPAHSFKFVATLQEKGCRARPYLIRIETRSGHVPISLPKTLEQRADVYAFLLAQTA